MSSETVKMSADDFEEYSQKEISRFTEIESEVMKAYGKEQMTLFYKIIDFTYKTLTVVGLVAGFGFTALGNTQNIYIFILGEAFLFLAIIYGHYRIHKLYNDNLKALDKNKVAIKKAFIDRRETLAKIIDSHLTKGEVEKSDLKALIEKNQAVLTPFLSGEEKEERSPLTIIMVIFILGVIFLLLAFIPTPFLDGQKEQNYIHLQQHKLHRF